jgi:hypothetical protein
MSTVSTGTSARLQDVTTWVILSENIWINYQPIVELLKKAGETKRKRQFYPCGVHPVA